MATHIFKVKADKDAVAVEHSVIFPDSLDVNEWTHLIEGDDEAVKARIIDLAMADWTVKCQAFLRKNSDKDASDFQYGAKVTRTRTVVQKIRIDATELGLDRAQIDALVAGGAEVHNIPEELIPGFGELMDEDAVEAEDEELEEEI